MLSLNVTALLKLRGIERPYHFLVQSGFTPNVATRIANDQISVMRLSHVELLCQILICEPSDLFVWTPDPKVQYPTNFPLQKLVKEEPGKTITDVISILPIQQLKAITETVVKQI
ncbi:MAG: helix-turn-helix transcriptional regulator [Bacteroidetes bacterium]|nr:helix-turn-helix transcriptional regulator [Bacteroidota bacterium]